MRKPETIEKLYLDFVGFFAGVMQQAMQRRHPTSRRRSLTPLALRST
jgi:hypothetical protein